MVEQGSDEWKRFASARRPPTRSGSMRQDENRMGASRANYAAQLVAERLTGNVAESYSNAAMEWEMRPKPKPVPSIRSSRASPSKRSTSFPHPSIEMSGASPDSYVGSDGLVEIKC